MNLDIVKYPHFVIKFKGAEQREIEIISGNMRSFKASRLEMILPLLFRHVKQEQLKVRREDAALRREQEETEAAARAMQELDHTQSIADDAYEASNLSDS